MPGIFGFRGVLATDPIGNDKGYCPDAQNHCPTRKVNAISYTVLVPPVQLRPLCCTSSSKHTPSPEKRPKHFVSFDGAIRARLLGRSLGNGPDHHLRLTQTVSVSQSGSSNSISSYAIERPIRSHKRTNLFQFSFRALVSRLRESAKLGIEANLSVGKDDKPRAEAQGLVNGC